MSVGSTSPEVISTRQCWPAGQCGGAKTWRSRTCGIAAQSLFLSFQIAHANLHKLAARFDTLKLDGQPAHRRPSDRNEHRNPCGWLPRAAYPGPGRQLIHPALSTSSGLQKRIGSLRNG